MKGFLQGRKRGAVAGECPVYLINLRMEQAVCLHGFVGQQGQDWQLSASLAGTACDVPAISAPSALALICDLSSEVAAEKSS